MLAFQLLNGGTGRRKQVVRMRSSQSRVCVHVSACASLPTYCTEKLMYIKRFAGEENLFLLVTDKELNLVMTKIDKVPF